MNLLESISDNKTDLVNNEVNEELGDDGSNDLKHKEKEIHTER